MELKGTVDDKVTHAMTIPAPHTLISTASASVSYFSLVGWMIPLPDSLLSGFSVFYCP